MWLSPEGMWRLYNVALTSMQCHERLVSAGKYFLFTVTYYEQVNKNQHFSGNEIYVPCAEAKQKMIFIYTFNL